MPTRAPPHAELGAPDDHYEQAARRIAAAFRRSHSRGAGFRRMDVHDGGGDGEAARSARRPLLSAWALLLLVAGAAAGAGGALHARHQLATPTAQPKVASRGWLGRPLAFWVYEGGRRVEWAPSDGSALPCNIIFVKAPKCASSTAGGVVRRIAAHHGLSGVGDDGWVTREPGVWANHGLLQRRWEALRQLERRSFLLTVVRLPVSRCLSAYYHYVESRHNTGWVFGPEKRAVAAEWARAHPDPDTAEAKLGYLRQSDQCKDYVHSYIRSGAAEGADSPQDQDSPHSLVQRVFSFVGLAERFDESMVMLAHMLQVL